MTVANSYLSKLNSTTRPLGVDEVYSGVFEKTKHPQVMVSCLVTGSGNLKFYFSNDNGATESTYPVGGFSVDSGIHEFHIAVKGPRSFRVELTPDSGTEMTSVSVYTYFGTFSQGTAPLNQSVGLDADGSVVRPTIAQDEITRGLRSGVSQVNKFGYRDDIDNADGHALISSDDATNTPTILTTASTFTITYNNATDGDGTTGATILLFDYIDANEDAQQTNVVLGSSGSDVTAFSGLGINRAVVVSNGGAEHNINDISITATTGGSFQAFIPAEVSVTQQLIFHIPRNTTPMLKYMFLSAVKLSGGGGAPRVEFRMFVYSRIVNTTFEIFKYLMDTDVENSREFSDPTNFPLSARDVVWITADTDTNNTSASGRFSMNIYQNN